MFEGDVWLHFSHPTDVFKGCAKHQLELSSVYPSTRTIWHAALTCRRYCSRIPMWRRLRGSWRRSLRCSDRVWPMPTLHRPNPGRLSPSQRWIEFLFFVFAALVMSNYCTCAESNITLPLWIFFYMSELRKTTWCNLPYTFRNSSERKKKCFWVLIL